MTTVRRCSQLRCYYLVWIVSDFSLVWLYRIEMRCAVDQRPTRRESQPCATLGFDNVCSCWAVAVRSTKESSSWREPHWFVAGWNSSCDQDWSESMFGHPVRHSEPEWRLEVKCCFHSTACSARCLRFLCVVGVVGEFRVFAENKSFQIMRNVCEAKCAHDRINEKFETRNICEVFMCSAGNCARGHFVWHFRATLRFIRSFRNKTSFSMGRMHCAG